jgi:glutamine synthetase adenylyltransferase
MKTITIEWLKSKDACHDGLDWFAKQNKEFELVELIDLLIKENQLEWANWLIVRVMDYSQYVSYAVYAAEQVIDIFEKKYPDDKHPREAIEAAKKCIKNPSDENKKKAYSAARAAYGASSAAYSAARVADWAAYNAARAAYWVACAASAADSAACAASAADSAACAAKATANAKILKKILKYGIELLREGK